MRLILAATAIISAFLPLLARAPGASACSCAAFPADEAGIRTILASPEWGTAMMAIGVAETSTQSGGSGSATVRIERVFRGVIGERVEITGEGLGGSCDYIPAEGSREFLVINETDNGGYAASLCGSRTLDPAADPGAAEFERTLMRVSAGTPPGPSVGLPDTGSEESAGASSNETSIRWTLVGGALALVSAAGAVVAMIRRRGEAAAR